MNRAMTINASHAAARLGVVALLALVPLTQAIALSYACTGGQKQANFTNTSAPGTSTGTIQSFTVPAEVADIVIDAAGAQGGDGGGSPGNPNNPGGLGAEVAADFSVSEGQVLCVLVGGEGKTASTYRGGGGGGGSFVYATSTDCTVIDAGQLLLAAGGGGGLLTNGLSGSNASGGYALVNGGYGAADTSGYSGHGGFGGGGANSNGGGGGGGYNGGGGGGQDPSFAWGGGGGGGSYSGIPVLVAASGVQTGNGAVTFCYTEGLFYNGFE